MAAMTPEQVRATYEGAVLFETNRRLSSQLPLDMDAIQQVGLEAVAGAQLMMSAPVTNEDPQFRRLARQARQFDHAINTATAETVRQPLQLMYGMLVAVATLGVQPGEWQEVAKSLSEAAVTMLAEAVATGHTTLPPAEHDHD